MPFPPGLLSAAVIILVASLGLGYADIQGLAGGRIRYGAEIGLAAAGVVAALALIRLRNRAFPWRRDLPRIGPIVASVAYLFLLLAPSWHVLPLDLGGVFGFGFFTWPTVTGAFGALVLIALWSRQVAFPQPQAWLVGLPLTLLALAAVDLIRLRDGGITWGNGTVVGLCLLLAAFGIVEQRVGLERVPFPDILRIDRL